MHIKILQDASDAQIKEFVTDFIFDLKDTNKEIYEKAENKLYDIVYGEHFNEWRLKCALEKYNGGHWSVKDTNEVASMIGFDLNGNTNQYDWNYAMNMVYSTFYGAVSDEPRKYADLAKRLISSGKIFRYYLILDK